MGVLRESCDDEEEESYPGLIEYEVEDYDLIKDNDIVLSVWNYLSREEE